MILGSATPLLFRSLNICMASAIFCLSLPLKLFSSTPLRSKNLTRPFSTPFSSLETWSSLLLNLSMHAFMSAQSSDILRSFVAIVSDARPWSRAPRPSSSFERRSFSSSFFFIFFLKRMDFLNSARQSALQNFIRNSEGKFRFEAPKKVSRGKKEQKKKQKVLWTTKTF